MLASGCRSIEKKGRNEQYKTEVKNQKTKQNKKKPKKKNSFRFHETISWSFKKSTTNTSSYFKTFCIVCSLRIII